MKAIERLFKYIEIKCINKAELERIAGISNGYLAKQYSRKADIGETILNSILENCPDINPEWLLTGNGEMLRSFSAECYVNSAPKSSTPNEALLLRILNKRDKEVKDLNREIGALSAQTEQLKERLHNLEVQMQEMRGEQQHPFRPNFCQQSA